MANYVNGMILRNRFPEIAILSIFFVFTACRTDQPISNMVEINVEKNATNFKPLTVCDLEGEIRYVSLKGDSIPLKAAAVTAFNEDHILVSDRTSCLLYGIDGNFKTRIGRRGKGPGEYLAIGKLQFGPDNTIYINDLYYFSIFDLAGKFLYKFKVESNPTEILSSGQVSSFYPVNDSVFIGQIRNDSGVEKYNAMFFDKSGRTVKCVENHIILNKVKYYSSSANGDANIYRKGEAVYIKERINDTVFRITDQYQFDPVYYIKLGKFGIPKEVRELPMREYTKKSMDYFKVYDVFESGKYLFIGCSFNNLHPVKDRENIDLPGTKPNWALGMLGVYNKSTSELTFAKVNTTGTWLTTCGLVNDFDGGINFYPKDQVNESTLSMWVDVYLLKEHVASDYFKKSTPKYPEKKKELERLVNSLSENDNPVLMLCTFK